jgi:hypothetical protein
MAPSAKIGINPVAAIPNRLKPVAAAAGNLIDLGKAYRQLQLYREALNNPPRLITSDIRTIRIIYS